MQREALGATGNIHVTNCDKDMRRQVALGGDPVEVRPNMGTRKHWGGYRQPLAWSAICALLGY